MGERKGPCRVALVLIINLSLIRRALRDRDRFSRSDPVCFVYAKGRGSRTWGSLGRTERTKDTTNPEWATTFLIDYYFEEKQASLIRALIR